MPFNLEVYQVLVPAIALFAIILTIKSHKSGSNSLFESFFWISLWLGIATVALIPDFITNALSRILGIKDNVNAIIFIGLAASFFIHFKTFNVIKRQNKTITDLVRKISLKDGPIKNKDN
jgi:hypothetical protein